MHATLLPQEVVSVKLINQEVVLNEDVFNGVLEKGITLTGQKVIMQLQMAYGILQKHISWLNTKPYSLVLGMFLLLKRS